MKKLFLLPAVLAFTAASVWAGDKAPEFSEVDTDRDGVLSAEEAKTALPDLQISDANGDGVINRSEVETAMPGLTLSADGEKGDTAPVGVTEYQKIVQTMELDDAGAES